MQHRTTTREQMRELDRLTIEEVGIPSIVLMENAGRGVFDVIRKRFASALGGGIAVVCGRGNNGGDGFVVARYALLAAHTVRVFTTAPDDDYRGEAATNLSILRHLGIVATEIRIPDGLRSLQESLASSAVVVDALLGTGLAGDVREPFASIIDVINDSSGPVVAVDIPSGLDANTGETLGRAVRADVTATLGYAKKGFYVSRGQMHTGEIEVIDIGIPDLLYEKVKQYSLPSITVRKESQPCAPESTT